MKKTVFFGLVLMALAGTIFAGEILPDFQNYVSSSMGADVNLISVYPGSPEAAQKLTQLRQGERPDLITVEWRIGPSSVPISSPVVELQKHQTRVALAASANAYVRGEVALLGYNEDMAAKIATEVSASIIFAETLRNNREELRLEYSYRNSDGSIGYGISFWLSIDKSSLDQEITDKAAAISSGNNQSERKTAGVRKPSRPVNSTTDNGKVVESVQTLMSSDERILRFREENQRLLGFDE